MISKSFFRFKRFNSNLCFLTQSITNSHIFSRSFSSTHSNFVSILAVLNHLTWNVWLFYLIRLCDKSYANNKRHLISHFLYHKNVTKTKCKRRSVINNKNGFRYHKANAQWLNDTWNNLMLLLWKFHFSLRVPTMEHNLCLRAMLSNILNRHWSARPLLLSTNRLRQIRQNAPVHAPHFMSVSPSRFK